jgi:hypothetical protein
VYAIEPKLIEAVVTRIHGYRMGRGSLDRLLEDLRDFARNYASRDPNSTAEFHAAWRKLVNIAQAAQPADVASEARQQATTHDALDTIVRVVRRL